MSAVSSKRVCASATSTGGHGRTWAPMTASDTRSWPCDCTVPPTLPVEAPIRATGLPTNAPRPGRPRRPVDEVLHRPRDAEVVLRAGQQHAVGLADQRLDALHVLRQPVDLEVLVEQRQPDDVRFDAQLESLRGDGRGVLEQPPVERVPTQAPGNAEDTAHWWHSGSFPLRRAAPDRSDLHAVRSRRRRPGDVTDSADASRPGRRDRRLAGRPCSRSSGDRASVS